MGSVSPSQTSLPPSLQHKVFQPNPTGTPLSPTPKTPTLFTPLSIRSLTLPHRTLLAPMGTYSSVNGHLTPWQYTHYSSLLSRGPTLTFLEATAVTPEGRTSPLDLGLYSDAHIEGLSKIIDFARKEGQKIGIQLGHSGWKGSMMPILPGRKMEAVRDEDGTILLDSMSPKEPLLSDIIH
ncbi:FMN-linked oxidoreductase [Polyplosphaeria fusca]|uniref:FMN-linked oxidoreductase n=1 Tax=Polyplosphaeria fusca TaxID=682080 RepID=A0A9P4UVL5_9PLEO|nr:FMN-linked oxidoreductase [Polyplosphaeria fusca]